ncbi:MAG TPA: hypothetical protein VEJ63_10290 [Planctomycetota bacterium]|nr:hypothetical protein [Planctomycetota bacterium]
MTKWLLLLASICCVLSFTSNAADAPTAEQIEKWVKELGSEDFDLRRAAETSLRSAGDAAREPLEKAAASTDPEVKARAGRLVGALKTEPILKKMEAASGAKNMEGDMKMTMNMMGMTMEMKGHYVGLADAKHFTLDATTSVMGQDIKMNMVADGKDVWTEVQPPGMPQKMVQKYSLETMEKMGGMQGSTPAQAVQDLRKRYVFTAVKDDKLGTEEVHVLEGSLNQDFVEEHMKKMEELAGKMAADMTREQVEKMKKSRIYVAKSDMIFRKIEALDDAGDPIMTLEMSNMKLGEKYDDAKFKYTPPKDAQIQDMDEALRMAKNMGGDASVPPGE